jgi:hypothetical protein
LYCVKLVYHIPDTVLLTDTFTLCVHQAGGAKGRAKVSASESNCPSWAAEAILRKAAAASVDPCTGKTAHILAPLWHRATSSKGGAPYSDLIRHTYDVITTQEQ